VVVYASRRRQRRFAAISLLDVPGAAMTDVILKRFERSDEIRIFELGRFEPVTLGGMTVGRATYLPGRRWSTDVGAAIGATHCCRQTKIDRRKISIAAQHQPINNVNGRTRR
jgi:hypothetical protein